MSRERNMLTRQQVAESAQVPVPVIGSLEDGAGDYVSFGAILAIADELELGLELCEMKRGTPAHPTLVSELELSTESLTCLENLEFREIASLCPASDLLDRLSPDGGTVLYELASCLSRVGISLPPASGRVADARVLEMLRLRIVAGLSLEAIGRHSEISREAVRRLLVHYFGESRRFGRPPRAGSATAQDRLKEIATLTPRETDVFERLVRAHANKRIAHELDLSVRTVEHYSATVTRKLKVSRRELVGLQLPAQT